MPSAKRARVAAFRPLLWPTVVTVPTLAVLLALGTWQVDRYGWKTDLVETRQSRAAASPIALPAPDADADGFVYHRVRATGRYLHENEAYLAARSLKSNVGYHVITPLALEDGRILLVNRGWIPLDRKNPASRAAGQVVGTVAVEGVLKASQTATLFTPDNRPEENFWYTVDVPALAVALGLEAALPYFVEAGPAENPGGLPIGGQSRIDLPNDHLQYAITWYALALALAVIYVLYHRGRAREEAGGGDEQVT